MRSTETYSVETYRAWREMSQETHEWIDSRTVRVGQMFSGNFQWQNFDMERYVDKGGIFVVCFRSGQPCGVLLARVLTSVLDNVTKILTHDLLYADPDTRAGYHLFKAYVDFGRRAVDHVTVTVTEHTNVSARSLKREGFIKLHDVYRLEVK